VIVFAEAALADLERIFGFTFVRDGADAGAAEVRHPVFCGISQMVPTHRRARRQT